MAVRQRGLGAQAALSRHHPRPAQVAAHLQLEPGARRLPDPLRRPAPRHRNLTVTHSHNRSHWYNSPTALTQKVGRPPRSRCALAGSPWASPSDPPRQAPCGVGCGQSDSHEHERPVARLRVRPFPAMMIPAGHMASADFSAVSDALSDAAVPSHPVITPSATGHLRTSAETSPDKTSNLPRTPTAST